LLRALEGAFATAGLKTPRAELRVAIEGGAGKLKLMLSAIERTFKAADSDARIPKDRQARLTLLRRGLIPWLAGIDPETRAPRRRVARLAEIPAEARPLIDHLVEQRLLATDIASDTGETTIEPTHEALLRQPETFVALPDKADLIARVRMLPTLVPRGASSRARSRASHRGRQAACSCQSLSCYGPSAVTSMMRPR